jgi:hypothetical protein
LVTIDSTLTLVRLGTPIEKVNAPGAQRDGDDAVLRAVRGRAVVHAHAGRAEHPQAVRAHADRFVELRRYDGRLHRQDRAVRGIGLLERRVRGGGARHGEH